MSINLDLTQILNTILVFFLRDSTPVLLDLFALFGWVVLVIVLFWANLDVYKKYRREIKNRDWKWVLLAIDIPAINVQTPKAVEQMFAQLAGVYDEPNIGNTYFHGYKQKFFSLEIISIEGYIQFLIRTEETFRDLVEAAVYAQYPDAEVIEVEDYVSVAPSHFPNAEYDVWTGDFGLAENEAYPIRMYREFEHAISKDTVLKDPMGTFLESFTRIGPGEQMWFQIVIEPVGNDWKKKAIKEIKNIIGDASAKKKGGMFEHMSKEKNKSWEELSAQILNSPRKEAEKKKEEPNLMRYLTPGQSNLVKMMEEKLMKIGFKTKIRLVYLARKEVFRSTRGVQSVIGALNQYNAPYSNSITVKLGMGIYYLFSERRKNFRKGLLVRAYKKRKIKAGGNAFVLNTEELATIWHFPMSHVKTPMVQKSATKRAEPPSGLPVESIFAADTGSIIPEENLGEAVSGYKTDSGAVIKNDEVKFG